MNVPSWVIELVLLAFGCIIFYLYKKNDKTVEENQHEVRLLIAQNRAEDEDVRRVLRGEMKELKVEVYSRVEASESKLVTAIEKIPDSLVSIIHCNGKQETWEVKFESLISAMEKAYEVRAETDAMAHKSLGDTLSIITKDLKQLAKSVNMSRK